MANRFAASDTLGFQLYDKHLREDIARERAEEARREQEKKARKARNKAKKHAGFQQAMRVVGGIAGAIAAPGTGGLSLAAGYGLGSAGGDLLTNVFPNMAGTKPNDSNPYYEPASSMQIADQSIRTGLQAYGQYNNHLKEEAKANLVDFTRSLTTNPRILNDGKELVSVDEALNEDQYYEAIINSPQYKDAKDIFGENVLSERTARDIAQNTYNSVGDQAMKSFQVINSAELAGEAKQDMINKWYGRYGSAYKNLLPEGMQEYQSEAIQKEMNDETAAKYAQLVNLELKSAASTGNFNKEVFDDYKEIEPVMGPNLLQIAENYQAAYKSEKGEELAKQKLEISVNALKQIDSNTPEDTVDTFVTSAAGSATTVGLMDEKEARPFFDAVAEVVQAPNTEARDKAFDGIALQVSKKIIGSELTLDEKKDLVASIQNLDVKNRVISLTNIKPDEGGAEPAANSKPGIFTQAQGAVKEALDYMVGVAASVWRENVSSSVSSNNNTVTDSDNATSDNKTTTSGVNYPAPDNASNIQLPMPEGMWPPPPSGFNISAEELMDWE